MIVCCDNFVDELSNDDDADDDDDELNRSESNIILARCSAINLDESILFRFSISFASVICSSRTSFTLSVNASIKRCSSSWLCLRCDVDDNDDDDDSLFVLNFVPFF